MTLITTKIIGLHEGEYKDYRPMDMEDASALGTLILTHKQLGPKFATPTVHSADEKWAIFPSAGKILMSRLETFVPSIEVSLWTAAWFAYCSSTPGVAVMYAWSLFKLQQTLGPMDLTKLVRESRYGDGIPTDEFAERCWRSQKVDGRNMLDRAEAWK
jgi:hypothetical protein